MEEMFWNYKLANSNENSYNKYSFGIIFVMFSGCSVVVRRPYRGTS